MKELSLTRGKAALVDDEHFETLNQFKWFAQHSPFTFYAARHISPNYKVKNGLRVALHRLISGAPKKLEVDHIDGNGLNNQRSNLRICTKSQNLRNIRTMRSRHGYRGIRKAPSGNWSAHYKETDGGRKYLGMYSSARQAADAFDNYVILIGDEWSNLNFGKNPYAKSNVMNPSQDVIRSIANGISLDVYQEYLDIKMEAANSKPMISPRIIPHYMGRISPTRHPLALKINVLDVIKYLPRKQQTIIKHRFGLNGKELTLDTLGRRYKLTKERIRQIETNCLDKMHFHAIIAIR